MDEVINFIKKHKEFYGEYLKNNRLSKCEYGYTCDINQIYCYLKLIDIKKTEYYAFYLLSKTHFNLFNKKILEIGCGYIPILASIYKKNNIDIDAINKNIIIQNYNGVNTIEADLSKHYNIEQYDLIIGFRPCNITENILNMCNKYHKDFIIYLCPCIHTPQHKLKKTITYEEWIAYLTKKILNFKNFKTYVIYNHTLPDSCPVLVGKYIK